jgi:acetyl-CoA carboxylase/biotin carboxylase 1
VFIYIPPCGELRGGAWVVLDPTINPEKMEMYCDENGRGGNSHFFLNFFF